MQAQKNQFKPAWFSCLPALLQEITVALHINPHPNGSVLSFYSMIQSHEVFLIFLAFTAKLQYNITHCELLSCYQWSLLVFFNVIEMI